VNATIAWITARGLFGRKRFLLLIPLPIILIGLAWLAATIGRDEPDAWTGLVLIALGVVVMLPLTSLIIGTAVLGSEIDDGTIVHILTKPIPRWQILITKLVVAMVASALTVGLPMFVAGALIDGTRMGLGFAFASAIGAAVYSALFVLLSVVSRRPVLLGLIYILVWEGLLGNIVSGTAVLSVQQYVLTLAHKFSGSTLFGPGDVSVRTSIIMVVVLTAAATAYAIERLRSFAVAGETS
jgi:ABC-2 type transport system permease protein